MAIKIVVDAVSNLFPNILKEKGLDDIKVMNVHLTIGQKDYLCYDDPIDIKEFSKTYYELMEKGEEVKTSLVSPGDYEELFDSEASKGNKVICFTMAKGISGTYNSACLARDAINEKYKEKVVEVIDSMTAGLGEGMQAIRAHSLIKEGIGFEELINKLEEEKHFIRSDFTVDDIRFLLKTGRVGKALARFVHLLNIKILLKRSEESKIAFAGSAIGTNNAIKQLSKLVIDKIDTEKTDVIYITHCNVIDNAERLKKMLIEAGIKNKIEIYDYDLVSGAHIGPKSLAIFYMNKEAY